MKTYTLTLGISMPCTQTVTIEAETPEDAISQALSNVDEKQWLPASDDENFLSTLEAEVMDISPMDFEDSEIED